MEKGMNAVRVILPTKRVAYLREPKIADNQLAAKMVGNKTKNQFELALAMQNELLKILLVQIDDEKLDHASKNDLDKIMSLTEYNILMKVVQKLAGGDEVGEEPEMEMAFI